MLLTVRRLMASGPFAGAPRGRPGWWARSGSGLRPLARPELVRGVGGVRRDLRERGVRRRELGVVVLLPVRLVAGVPDGGLERGDPLGVLARERVDGDRRADAADDRGVGDRRALELLVVEHLLQEAVVVGPDDRDQRLAGGLVRV